nr:hypothetical protein [Candidatus Sigynarchaeum springense]
MESLTDEQRRNIYLIKREFIRELDHGLGKIKKLISREYSGLLTNIPSNIFYYMYVRGGVRQNIITQIKISLKMAIEFDGKNIDQLVDKYKAEYLKNDLISLHCKKDHPIFAELQEITINNMYSRVPILHALIHSKGATYDDLVKNAFNTREAVRHVLEIQLIFIDQWIELLGKNKDAIRQPNIANVDIPISSEKIFKIIVETYDYGLARLEHKLDGFFPPSHGINKDE